MGVHPPRPQSTVRGKGRPTAHIGAQTGAKHVLYISRKDAPAARTSHLVRALRNGGLTAVVESSRLS